MNPQEFLYAYLNANSPTGFESEGQKIWLNYLKTSFDDCIIDNYGSVAGIINPNTDYKVVIEAHADEISWFVNYINDDGYIYVIRNGGSDAMIAPSMRVVLHTKKEKLRGVFGWPAIHVRSGEKNDPKPELDNIFIDVGAKSKAEVLEMGIHVGTVVTFEADLFELNNRYYVGRALDNRMGGYIIAQVVKRLKENKIELPYTLYVVNSVQEEVGLYGARMMADTIKPHVALCTDVCHDTFSPLGYNKIKEGATKAGEGPVLSYAPSMQNNLRDMLIDVAEKNKIQFQRDARSRMSGTDTDAFAYSNGGVVSALISLPLKYMHTTVETAHKDDVEDCIKLMYEFLIQLPKNHDFRYFKF
ncbi:MAG: M42 family peptidase [Bacteroidetes bacterium]|nr:MAG: M42 family peptidase [Bacteroidota bacterium]TAG92436.1 MAG: M42 family peptidase [Bacteroidota bacterium]